MKKRFASRHVLLAAIGSVAAVSVTAACDEPEKDEDVNVYASVDDCAKQMPPSICNAAYAAALKHHVTEAPKFASEPDCTKEFGKCEPTGTPATLTTDGKTLDDQGRPVSFRPVFAGFAVPAHAKEGAPPAQTQAFAGGTQVVHDTVVVHDDPLIFFGSYPVYHPLSGGYYAGSGVHITNNYGPASVAPSARFIRSSPVVVPRGASFTSTAPSFSARSISVARPSVSVSRGGFGSIGRASAAGIGA